MPKRPEVPITNSDIAAYLNREPEPVYKRFPSHKHRVHHAGHASDRAQHRRLR